MLCLNFKRFKYLEDLQRWVEGLRALLPGLPGTLSARDWAGMPEATATGDGPDWEGGMGGVDVPELGFVYLVFSGGL